MQLKENYHGHHDRKPHRQGRRLDGAPEIGVIFGNLAPAPGGDENKKVILWNNPQ